MSDKTLEQLLEQQAEIAAAIAKKQKEEQTAIIDEIVAKIKKYGITAKQLSSAFGLKTPNLEAKERKPAKDKYCFMWEGKEQKWTGRGRPTREIVAFCESKKISVDQFKNSPEYKLPE